MRHEAASLVGWSRAGLFALAAALAFAGGPAGRGVREASGHAHATCGDGSCTNSGAAHHLECDVCPGDCTFAACCGNGACNSGIGETCSTCAADCGACCGDGTCDGGIGETCSTCSTDCGGCPLVTGSIGGYASTCGNGINPQLAGGSGGSGALVPGLPDLVLVAPNTMIMLDSAATMEYLPGGGTAMPTCTPGDPTGTNELNKWWITLSALTGSLEAWSCDYDSRPNNPSGRPDHDISPSDYPDPPGDNPPHVVMFAGGQDTDGLLDAYNGLLKFGLMTFDNDPDRATNASGLWSYDAAFGSPAINLGARDDRAERGALISVGLETKDDMNVVNGMVQSEALCTIPTHWGRPLSAVLGDFAEYARTSSDIAPPPSSGAMIGFDPWHECRDRGAVLITDGAPDLYDGTIYPTAATAAADVLMGASEIKTYVVAIGAPAGDRPVIDAIALAGGTNTAYYASDLASMRLALNTIFGSLASGITTRTVPAVTNGVASASAKQFEFSAAIEVSSGPWIGRLERTRFECMGLVMDDVYDPLEDDFGYRLTSQASREIFTFSPDGSATRADFDTSISADWLGAASSAERDAIVAYVLGDSGSGRSSKLGDIFNSGPVISTSPALDLPMESYRRFKTFFGTVGNERSSVLYAGSNDGILHAFDVAAMSPDPVELWGFVPPYVLAELKDSLSGHAYLVDGTAAVQDVLLRRDLSTTIPATVTDPRQTGWYTVLLAPLGNGGRAVYGLDVTTPDLPATVEMLFEFADSAPDGDGNGLRDACNTAATTRTCDPDLGLVIGTPAIARVVVEEGGTPRELGVGVIPGGYAPAGAAATVGRAAFVVGLDDGHLIKKFDAATRCTGETEAFDGAMIGDVTAYNDFPGTFMTRFFAGDMLGRLWRFDTSSSSPADWCQTVFTPASYRNGKPIFDAPSLALNGDNQLVLVYGTGDLANLLNTDGGNFVISLTEEIARDPATGAVTSVTPVVNWVRALEDGEKVAGVPVVFDECAYFATFVPDSDTRDLCTVGHGRLWGVHFTGTDPSVAVTADVEPCFDGDGDPATFDPVTFIELPDGSLSSGVSVVRRPACFETDTIDDPTNPDPSVTLTRITNFVPGTYSITAHIGSVAAGGNTPGTIPKIEREVTPPRTSGLATSWGEIFD